MQRAKSKVVTHTLAEPVAARKATSAYEAALEVGVFDAPKEKTPSDLARNHEKHIIAALKTKHRQWGAIQSDVFRVKPHSDIQ